MRCDRRAQACRLAGAMLAGLLFAGCQADRVDHQAQADAVTPAPATHAIEVTTDADGNSDSNAAGNATSNSTGTTAAQASPARNPAPPRLRVIGTEPFWGIEVDGDRLHFNTLENQAGRDFQATRQSAGTGWRWAGDAAASAAQPKQAFMLSVQPGACSDGMSDRAYAYRARFSIGPMDYRGCADVPEKFSGEGGKP